MAEQNVHVMRYDGVPPGTLHLLVGPVGAGKTTFARERIGKSPAILLDLDSSMVRLFGQDQRPAEGVIAWYVERRERCRNLLWDVACEVLVCGSDVFLELGLVQRAEREAYYERARSAGFRLVVNLLDAPRSVRRKRVAARNKSLVAHTQIVPLEFFEIASDAWEPPGEDERRAWNLVDCSQSAVR